MKDHISKTLMVEESYEYHLPFTNYVGPGTHIIDKINNRVLPRNRLDAAALIHDIEYYGLPQSLADVNMIENVNLIYKPLVAASFALKNLVGYDIPTNKEVYKNLKIQANIDPIKKSLKDYNVEFYEDKIQRISEENDKDERSIRGGFTTGNLRKVGNDLNLVKNKSDL